ncbi:hypothetical protein N0V88_002391 [Collariella sp. IMI 366227]|nr:hypothetical protein N0V88_002391 [Collariella sp. IMI 366227]
MASLNGGSVFRLETGTATSIAQLGPDLPDQPSRVVRGEVTITWPYNSVKQTFAFLLAEPDVRLRRAKGQIRVELQGPSAQAASESGLGAGDELLFSLDGVEWSKDVSPGRIPGARVEWQMQFNEKLVLQVKFGESGEIKHISIDHPAEKPSSVVAEPHRLATPEPEVNAHNIPSAVRTIQDFPENEYPSPAFVKRARLSYGALFEGGFDIFEDDGGVKGRGRKRTRFGRDSSAWRYTSQSPSPEPSSAVDAMDEDIPEEAAPQASSKPQMTDDGCQTMDVEMAGGSPQLAGGEFLQPEESAAVLKARMPATPEASAEVQEEHIVTQGLEQAPMAIVTEKEPAPATQTEETTFQRDKSPPVPEARSTARQEQAGMAPVQETKAQEQPPARGSHPLSPPEDISSATFSGPKPLLSSFSIHDAYPVAYLEDAPDPAKYADMNTYINVAEDEDEMVLHGQRVPPAPPALERFGHGQFEMSTQSPQYNPIEGGHFGADALDEGSRITSEQPSLHADEISPESVPGGFGSYGQVEAPEEALGSPARETVVHEEQPFVENEETISSDEVGVEDEGDEEAEYDEYAYGERLEEGDYDQRNYDIPADDDEGLSEQDDEIELEAEERYGNGEMYDEDGEGEEWDEEERDYESDEEEEYDDGYDARGPQPRAPTTAGPPGEPVVIDLISDSEDDQPTPAPNKPAPAAQSAPRQAPQEFLAAAEAQSPPQHSPQVLQSVEKDVVEETHLPDRIFGSTHVVDFATLASGANKAPLNLPAAEISTPSEPSSFASQAPISFEISSVRDDLRGPGSEAARSEGSSEGLFISQPYKAQAKEDTRTEDGSGSDLKRTDGASTVGDGIFESDEQEQGRHQEEVMSVDGMDEDEDTRMSDADSSSAATRSDVDKDLVEEEEEEYVGADDEPVHNRSVSFEVEEITMSEDDVDLLDASSPVVESAPSERVGSRSLQPESPGESVIISEVVMTEVVEETVITANDDESLPDAEPFAQQAARVASPGLGKQETAAGELQETTLKVSTEQSEAVGMEVDVEEPPSGQDQASIPVTARVVAVAPTESQPEVDEDLATEDRANNGSVSEPAVEILEASSLLAEPPKVMKLDEDIAEVEVVEVSPEVEENQPQQTVAESELISQGSEEPAEQPPSSPADDMEDETMILEQLTQDTQRSFETEARSPSPDLSVDLARQSAAARRRKQPAPEPTRTSPPVTRARSSSLRSHTSPEHEAETEEDSSVHLARAALVSPSRHGSEADEQPGTVHTTTSLKSNLAKRLHDDLPDCIPLKSLRQHAEKSPGAVAVVTSSPTQPARAKGGPREYFMSFHVTDPSTAPDRVVEVQLYRPHKDSLPVVKPGDVVLLRGFQVKAIGKKGFGLRTGVESAWAVWDGEGVGEDEGKEEWGRERRRSGTAGGGVGEVCGLCEGLKEWFASLDGVARGKIERADRKMAEVGGSR